METLNLLLFGSGVGMATIKSLLLLLLLNYDLIDNEEVKKRIDEIMKSNPQVKDTAYTKEFLGWLHNDNFQETTIKLRRNNFLLLEISTLRRKILDDYLMKLSEVIENEPEKDTLSCDVYNELAKSVVQILRLRMVIEPEVQISRNVHPVTNHAYLAAKAFWLTDSGEKVRKFTKSLGLAEKYDGGREDPKALEEGTALIQEVMYALYKETYPS